MFMNIWFIVSADINATA